MLWTHWGIFGFLGIFRDIGIFCDFLGFPGKCTGFFWVIYPSDFPQLIKHEFTAIRYDFLTRMPFLQIKIDPSFIWHFVLFQSWIGCRYVFADVFSSILCGKIMGLYIYEFPRGKKIQKCSLHAWFWRFSFECW